MAKAKQHRDFINSITTRLMAAFLLIVIPLQIAAYLIFDWSSQRLQSGIEQETVANASFLQSKINSELSFILQAITSLINDTSVMSLAYQQEAMQPATLYIALKEMQSRLLIIRSSNLLLEDVFIHFNRHQKILSYEDYYSEDTDKFHDLVDRLRGESLFYALIDGKLNLVDMYPSQTRFGQKYPEFLVRTTISSEALSQYLSDFSEVRQKNIAIFQQSSDFYLYGKSNLLEGDDFRQLLDNLALPNADNSSRIATISLSGSTYYTVALFLPLIDCVLVQAVPITQINAQQMVYRSFLTFFILLSIILFVVYAFLTQRLVQKPVGKLISGFAEIGRGNYDIKIDLRNPASEFRDLIVDFNNMASQLNDAVNNLYRQEIYVKEIELKQLQMQINPHFLYNSYFMLSRLVDQEDLESARRLAAHLGEYFQFITRNGHDRVPLSTEWRHTKSYLDIQVIRYAPRIVVEIDEVPVAYQEYVVPRLILQPIVENALEHGLIHKTAQGLVRLYFDEDPAFLRIFVEDNGEDITADEIEMLQQRLDDRSDSQRDTTALVNIHRRLQLAYGQLFGIKLRLCVTGGLQVELRLPAISPDTQKGTNMEDSHAHA